MPNDDVPWQLLERDCDGTASAAERAALAAWVGTDPRRQLLVDRLRTLFAGSVPVTSEADVERAWARVAASMTADAAADRRWSRWPLLRLARARFRSPRTRLTVLVLLLALAGGAWYLTAWLSP